LIFNACKNRVYELREAKTHYFPVFVRKCQMLGIFTALKTKEFTLVNDCFQCKNNPARRNKLVASAGGEADGVLWQTLFSYHRQTTQQMKYRFRGILNYEV
jgi:hypothetical protein